MSKFNPKKLTNSERYQLLDELFMAISIMSDFKDIKNFLKDLLSESESVMLARRLQIAKMLLNEHTYEDIKEELGVGHTTINNVRRWLDYGREGYVKAISNTKKMKKNNKINEDEINPFSWYNVSRKYHLKSWPQELVGDMDEFIRDYVRKYKRRSSIKKHLR